MLDDTAFVRFLIQLVLKLNSKQKRQVFDESFVVDIESMRCVITILFSIENSKYDMYI